MITKYGYKYRIPEYVTLKQPVPEDGILEYERYSEQAVDIRIELDIPVTTDDFPIALLVTDMLSALSKKIYMDLEAGR